MKLLPAIDYACNALEQAGHDGHLVNQSMVGFVFCKALGQQIPDAQIVYDGRESQTNEASPNLFIWQEGAIPVLHFVGNIRYGLHDDPDCREQFNSLKNLTMKPTIPVLTHAPDSISYFDVQMETSPNLVLGLLIVNEQKAVFQQWSAHGKREAE